MNTLVTWADSEENKDKLTEVGTKDVHFVRIREFFQFENSAVIWPDEFFGVGDIEYF